MKQTRSHSSKNLNKKTQDSHEKETQEISHYSWFYWIFTPIFLSITTIGAYYRSFHYEFQFDDIANITKHFDIRHNSLKTLWFSGTRWLSYWLNAIHYSIGKFDPFSYRVGTVTIHTLNGVLIFFLLFSALIQLKKESFFKKHAFILSLITALLFLLHPVQTQTVSYVIQGELEGLSAFFILSMSLCYLKFVLAKNHTTKIFLGFLLFSLSILSCGTKEIAIISPMLLLLVDWFFIAQGSWQSLKSRSWLIGLLAGTITTIYLYLLKPAFFAHMFELKKNNIGNVITESPDIFITPWAFFISQFKVILHYLWMFIWPLNISVEYDWVLAKDFFAPDCIFPFLALVLIAFLLYRHLRVHTASLLGFGALWFAVCLAPRTSFIPSPELLVDYKTYLASFGWLFLIAAFLIYVVDKMCSTIKSATLLKHSWTAHAAFTCILVVTLSTLTIKRNMVWHSGLEFWENVIVNAPGKARAYNNYAVELALKLHKFADSVPYFKKAIAMDAKYPDPCNNLAVAYSQLGQIDDAIAALRQGLAINPYYPEGYNNLASFYLQKKDLESAEQNLRVALQMRPYYGKAYFNLGRVYLERKENEKAWECFKNCCTKADLDTDIGFATYGKISLVLQKYDDAIIGFRKTLEISPDYPDAAFNLGNAYHLSGHKAECIATFEHLITRNPNETRAVFNLGEAYLQCNEIEKALRCFKKLEPISPQMPYVPIRMAACYTKMGNINAAKHILKSTTINTTMPENIRQLAQQLLDNKQNWMG